VLRHLSQLKGSSWLLSAEAADVGSFSLPGEACPACASAAGTSEHSRRGQDEGKRSGPSSVLIPSPLPPPTTRRTSSPGGRGNYCSTNGVSWDQCRVPRLYN